MDENQKNKPSNRRKFLTNITKVMGGVGAVFAAIPFLSTMSPSEKTKMAGAPIEIDLSGIKPGPLKLLNGEENQYGLFTGLLI